jgi:glutaredoxin-like YruB-family protein
MAKVTIYTTPTCVYCKMAKDFFKNHNIEYEEKDVTKDEALVEEMVEKSGQMGVPVIDIDGQIVVGFNEEMLSKLLNI